MLIHCRKYLFLPYMDPTFKEQSILREEHTDIRQNVSKDLERDQFNIYNWKKQQQHFLFGWQCGQSRGNLKGRRLEWVTINRSIDSQIWKCLYTLSNLLTHPIFKWITFLMRGLMASGWILLVTNKWDGKYS